MTWILALPTIFLLAIIWYLYKKALKKEKQIEVWKQLAGMHAAAERRLYSEREYLNRMLGVDLNEVVHRLNRGSLDAGLLREVLSGKRKLSETKVAAKKRRDNKSTKGRKRK